MTIKILCSLDFPRLLKWWMKFLTLVISDHHGRKSMKSNRNIKQTKAYNFNPFFWQKLCNHDFRIPDLTNHYKDPGNLTRLYQITMVESNHSPTTLVTPWHGSRHRSALEGAEERRKELQHSQRRAWPLRGEKNRKQNTKNRHLGYPKQPWLNGWKWWNKWMFWWNNHFVSGWKWWFPTIFYVMIWNHPIIETTV